MAERWFPIERNPKDAEFLDKVGADIKAYIAKGYQSNAFVVDLSTSLYHPTVVDFLSELQNFLHFHRPLPLVCDVFDEYNRKDYGCGYTTRLSVHMIEELRGQCERYRTLRIKWIDLNGDSDSDSE